MILPPKALALTDELPSLYILPSLLAPPMKMSLRILLIGGGGREHALAWKLSQSRRVEVIYAIPGNGGTAGIPKVQNIDSVKADDYIGLLKFSKENKVDLVVPGPEAPLVDGIEGYFPRGMVISQWSAQ